MGVLATSLHSVGKSKYYLKYRCALCDSVGKGRLLQPDVDGHSDQYGLHIIPSPTAVLPAADFKHLRFSIFIQSFQVESV
jgi:hypothetical protein